MVIQTSPQTKTLFQRSLCSRAVRYPALSAGLFAILVPISMQRGIRTRRRSLRRGCLLQFFASVCVPCAGRSERFGSSLPNRKKQTKSHRVYERRRGYQRFRGVSVFGSLCAGLSEPREIISERGTYRIQDLQNFRIQSPGSFE